MRIPLAFLVLAAPALVHAQSVTINEIVARNATGFRDEDGDPSDWIELHNPTARAIDLTGHYLTDDPARPTRWMVPSTHIPSGGYLVVFASGKDRGAGSEFLHTNFKLSGDGEYLALIKPDGKTVVHAFAPFPEQRTDVSWGKRTGVAGFGYFTSPTPRAQNGRGLDGITADAKITRARGFYDSPVTTTITTASPGAVIRYTTNGSPPTAVTGQVYSGPIAISRSTVLRAAAFKPNFVPSRVDTKTYLFVEDIVRQPMRPAGYPAKWGTTVWVDYGMDPEIVNDRRYSAEVRKALRAIPAISVVLPIDDMFGPRGIYSNPGGSGRAWERACSAEFIPSDAGEGVQIDCGLRIQGGFSRQPKNTPKHAMSLRFRSAYGKGMLEYPIFPDSRVERFDVLSLRAPFNNSWTHLKTEQRQRALLIRDRATRASMVEMGNEDAGRDRHVQLFVNGLYWGIYVAQERQDAAHYATWNGGTEEDYDARNAQRVIDGSDAQWLRMMQIVRGGDWVAIQKAIDVDNFIDWLIVNHYALNTDFRPLANWRTAGGGRADAPWHFYCWDAELTFVQPNARPLRDPSAVSATLRKKTEFKVRFGDRLHRHFFHGGALTPARVQARWQAVADEIDSAIVAESARWGDYRRDVHRFWTAPYHLYTRDAHWQPELDRLKRSYFPKRSGIMLNNMRATGFYPRTTAPTFSKHGGSVPRGFKLGMTAPTGTIWFTLDGEDPRMPGGGVSGSARKYSAAVSIDDTTRVKARVLNGKQWSALNEATFLVQTVVLNELLAINRNGLRDNAGERDDWLELYNASTSPTPVGGLYLTDDPSNLTKWKLPAQTVQPGAFLLIWADDDGGQGPLHANFKLSGSGEEVLLVHRDGATVLDRIAFGVQQADVSTGRFTDGGPRLVTFPDPTPRESNAIAVCGARRYSALDPRMQRVALALVGTPGLGKQIQFEMRGGAPRTVHGLYFSRLATEESLPFSDSRLLVQSPILLLGTVSSDDAGLARMPLTIPPDARLVGQRVVLQAWTTVGSALVGSNGLEVTICR